MRIRCRKCGAEWDHRDRIGVRDECPECAAYLHTCMECRNFDARLSACRLPNTEPIRERTAQNFCEDFSYGSAEESEATAEAGGEAREAKPSPEDARRKFENLFRDAAS